MLTIKIKNLRPVLLSLIGIIFYLSSIQNTLAAQSISTPPKPWFYGGGIGAAFGDVKFFEISPLVGYKINPKTAVGVSFLYRYGTDNRLKESYSTTDYGATLFARYSLTPSFYLQAEYEYLDYEYAIVNLVGNVLRTERDQITSLFAGAGFLKPLGENVSMYITALYNFDYDDNASPYPYSDPVSIRLGVGVGF